MATTLLETVLKSTSALVSVNHQDCVGAMHDYMNNPNTLGFARLFLKDGKKPVLELSAKSRAPQSDPKSRRVDIPLELCGEAGFEYGAVVDDEGGLVRDLNYWEDVGANFKVGLFPGRNGKMKKWQPEQFIELQLSTIPKNLVWNGDDTAEMSNAAQQLETAVAKVNDLSVLVVLPAKEQILSLAKFQEACEALPTRSDELASDGDEDEDENALKRKSDVINEEEEATEQLTEKKRKTEGEHRSAASAYDIAREAQLELLQELGYLKGTKNATDEEMDAATDKLVGMVESLKLRKKEREDAQGMAG